MQAQSKQCAECGATFHRPPRRSAAQWERMQFCKLACANTWRALNSEGAGAAFKGGPGHAQKIAAGRVGSPYWQGTRRRRAEAARARRHAAKHAQARRCLTRAAKGTRGTRRWIAGPCASCGLLFVRSNVRSICCSRLCQRRVDRQKRRDAYGNHRERAKHYGVVYEPVKRADIFKRDDYRCALCRKRTDPTVRFPHPRFPTLDHIVPMACGGGHIRSNLQCACLACNCKKGERAANDQLLLDVA